MSGESAVTVIEPIWRADYAEACFHAFHSFYSLPNRSPADDPWPAHGFKWQPEEGESQRDLWARYARLADDNFANQLAFWTIVKREATSVTWAEVRTRLGMTDSNGFREILWSAIKCSMDDDIRSAGETFAKSVEAAGIYLPSSTEIQPAMEYRIGQAFKNAGFFDLRLTSEVQDYDVAITVDDLISSTPIMAFVPIEYSVPDGAPDVRLRRPNWVPSEIYAPDRAMKCVVEYESISTDFFGTKEALEAARLDGLFEGEWLPHAFSTLGLPLD